QLNPGRTSCFVTDFADELHGDVEFTVPLPDFLRDALGAFADASCRFGVEGFPGRDSLHDRVEVGQDLRVRASGIAFGGGHTIILSRLAIVSRTMGSLVTAPPAAAGTPHRRPRRPADFRPTRARP